MTDYICPACRGGFIDDDFDGECPWCGFKFGEPVDVSREQIQHAIDHTVTYTVEREEPEDAGVLRTLGGILR